MSNKNTSSSTQEDTITVFLVDDHTMMREGTRRLLEEDASLQVIGEAQDGKEAIALCQEQHPDVVILDISMKGMHGFGIASALVSAPEPPLFSSLLHTIR